MKKSIWQKTPITKTITTLNRKEIEVDIAIIGGGITGISTAALLKQSQYRVAVLEGDSIAASNTGKSTGNLYTLLDTPLKELVKKYNMETISKVISSRKDALDLIENLIKDYQINCSFKRVPWLLYSATENMDEFIRDEYLIAKELKLDVKWIEEGAPELEVLKGRCGLQIPHQAQFNPYSYVNELAEKINSENVSVYERTRIKEIRRDEDGFILKTSTDLIIYAKKVIHATHTPLEFSPLQTLVAPYREYGIALPLIKDFKDGIYWGYYDKENIFSIRKHQIEGMKYAIAVGGPHKVGQGEGEDSLKDLKEKLYHLGIVDSAESVEWSGQHFRSTDYLPFIGEGLENNTFLCTGFSTDGLIFGTLSAMIFNDILNKRSNQYLDLYRPHRLAAMGTKTFVKENLNVLGQYVFDYFKSNETEHPQRGEGKIISYRGDKFAVSKDDNGNLYICSAVCTHMGCIVHWNNSEKSWDCPCHGSRFTDSGEVIEGPAIKNLVEGLQEDS